MGREKQNVKEARGKEREGGKGQKMRRLEEKERTGGEWEGGRRPSWVGKLTLGAMGMDASVCISFA